MHIHTYTLQCNMQWVAVCCSVRKVIPVSALQQSATGWRRPIGCLKLQVIFHKRATNHRALLRKTTCKDKASYVSSPPCRTQVRSVRICRYLCMHTTPTRENARHTHTLTHIHTHTYTYIYTYVCIPFSALWQSSSTLQSCPMLRTHAWVKSFI